MSLIKCPECGTLKEAHDLCDLCRKAKKLIQTNHKGLEHVCQECFEVMNEPHPHITMAKK